MVDRIRLAGVLAGLSLAADLGFGVPPDEAVRSCVIGTSLARTLDLSESEVAAVFYTALLHHIGCTAFAHETALVFGDELAMNAAAAKTNFDDPRDMFRTFLPEVTRGARPLERARVVAFALPRGSRFGRRFTIATCEVARETARRRRKTFARRHGEGGSTPRSSSAFSVPRDTSADASGRGRPT